MLTGSRSLSLQIRMKTMPASMYRLLVGLETPQHIWSNQGGFHAYIIGALRKKNSPSVKQSERIFTALTDLCHVTHDHTYALAWWKLKWKPEVELSLGLTAE